MLGRRVAENSVIELHCFLMSEAQPRIPNETFATTLLLLLLINLAKNTAKRKSARRQRSTFKKCEWRNKK